MATQSPGVATEYDDMTISDAVLAYLEESGPATPKQIAEGTGKKAGSVRPEVRRMAERDEIEELPEWQRDENGEYGLPEQVQSKVESSPSEDNVVSGEIDYPLTQVGGGPGRSTDDTMTVDKKLMRSELGRVPSADEGFWAQVQGTSMEPWIRDGQYVFALRQKQIDSPARYIIWWGDHQADVCCYLAKMSSTTVLLRKFGPEKEYRLHHKEGDIYEIDDGTTVRMQVRGRVVWPPDTARSVMETVTDQTAKIVEKALGE